MSKIINYMGSVYGEANYVIVKSTHSNRAIYKYKDTIGVAREFNPIHESAGVEPYHLYIFADVDISKGDIVMPKGVAHGNGVWPTERLIGDVIEIADGFAKTTCINNVLNDVSEYVKILAATDKTLEGIIPIIPERYVQEYCDNPEAKEILILLKDYANKIDISSLQYFDNEVVILNQRIPLEWDVQLARQKVKDAMSFVLMNPAATLHDCEMWVKQNVY